MNELENNQEKSLEKKNDQNQKGSALVIAVFVLVLVSVFVALALSRTTAEAIAVGNETGEGRTVYAAQGSLEMMTRNFNKVFETRLNPSAADLALVTNSVEPGLNNFTFNREVDPTSNSVAVVLTGGPYTGLYAIRDNWRLRTTATETQSGIQVQLTRNILNNRIPIFQFGIFYDDDLELYRPPRFSFGGRVHSNSNFFISPGADGVYFDSRVTAAKHIITQTWRNGNQSDSGNNQTFIKDASRVDQQLLPTMGSVLNTTYGAPDNIFASKPDLPPSRLNPNFGTQSAIFDGNLQSEVKPLKLPLNVGANIDLAEMVRRGKKVADINGGDLFDNAGTLAPVTAASVDNDILKAERFANKTGIRISLADRKEKLPGCASGVGTNPIPGDCGVMLDGHRDGVTSDPLTLADATTAGDVSLAARGYQPKPMKMSTGSGTFDYKSTRINGERLYQGDAVTGRRVWIKIETVQTNSATGAIETKDITQDFLSLGITEQAPSVVAITDYDETPPSSSLTSTSAESPSTGTDSRSIVKIQRFAIPGDPMTGEAYSNSTVVPPTTTRWLYPYLNYNFVVRYLAASALITAGCVAGCANVNDDPNSSRENLAHLKKVYYDGVQEAAIVPFPIEMFDTREGTYYDDAGRYSSNKVTQNGVMSVIDIDVANLRRFFRGDFNGLFPTDTPFAISKGGIGLVNADIPQKEGWVFYVSDRRGDADFDGEYDMEDIYGAAPGNDGTLQVGEDLDFPGTPGFGALNFDFINEATRYSNEWFPDYAAVNDHKYYRRGIRLINGATLPGVYDSVTASNTRGFTLSSENGVYVQGNYNATGVTGVPALGNTPYDNYIPFNSPTHIPASIVADSVTILSNNWNDAKSFIAPYDLTKRKATDTTVRFGMISGDTIASRESSPNQGGISPKLNGGVHNFKRFLERWTDPGDSSFHRYLNYSGSLINLYNSHNNNGAFKCCNTVYNPPVRNWVFDSTFLDPTRLPPGTPFFQYVQVTGFQRTND